MGCNYLSLPLNRLSEQAHEPTIYKVTNNPFSYLPTYTTALVQDCSNSIANALELLSSFTKPSTYDPHMESL